MTSQESMVLINLCQWRSGSPSKAGKFYSRDSFRPPFTSILRDLMQISSSTTTTLANSLKRSVRLYDRSQLSFHTNYNLSSAKTCAWHPATRTHLSPNIPSFCLRQMFISPTADWRFQKRICHKIAIHPSISLFFTSAQPNSCRSGRLTARNSQRKWRVCAARSHTKMKQNESAAAQWEPQRNRSTWRSFLKARLRNQVHSLRPARGSAFRNKEKSVIEVKIRSLLIIGNPRANLK